MRLERINEGSLPDPFFGEGRRHLRASLRAGGRGRAAEKEDYIIVKRNRNVPKAR